jgi:hypothetical protein
VEEARSALEANKSRGKVIDFVMNLKNAGTLPGVHGRLVCFLLCFFFLRFLPLFTPYLQKVWGKIHFRISSLLKRDFICPRFYHLLNLFNFLDLSNFDFWKYQISILGDQVFKFKLSQPTV